MFGKDSGFMSNHGAVFSSCILFELYSFNRINKYFKTSKFKLQPKLFFSRNKKFDSQSLCVLASIPLASFKSLSQLVLPVFVGRHNDAVFTRVWNNI